jgi:chromosome segregation ATPase
MLLAFIFLRDRDLRQRLNEFLSGAKKRMKRTQLQIRLNREKRKRTVLLKELGKKAWVDKVSDDKYKAFFHALEHLEKQGSERQTELQGILSRITDLQKKQEDARKTTKQLLKLKEAGEVPDGHKIHEAKEEEKRLKKEIRDGDRKIKAGQEFLKAIDRQKEEQFIEIGALIDRGRPEHKDFLGIYVQIDKLNRNILHYLNEIEKFR